MNSSLKMLLPVSALLVLTACGSGGGGKYAKAFASPDEAYVAIVVSDIGSEFGGSSCTDTVVVVPRASVASGRYPADSRAYVGACHSLKMTSINGQRALPDAPQLRWTAPHALTIVFDPSKARHGAVLFYTTTSLYDGLVTVHNAR